MPVRGGRIRVIKNRTYCSDPFALSLGRLVYIAATLGCSLYLLET